MGYKEHFIISLAFTGITTLILGIFIYIRNRHNKINITFSLYSISIAWWSLTQIGNVYGPSLERSWFWARIEQIGVVFIPTFFVHFIMAFLGLKRKWLLRFCYIFSIIIAFLSPTTSMISPRAERKFGVINFGEPGILYPLLIIFFVICISYGLKKLLEAYKISTGIKRNQLKYLLWPSLFGYIGGGANFLLVYDISIYPLNPFGTYFVGLYVFAVAYAILKYRLLDINIAITRAGIFLFVYTFVLGIPFWLGYATKAWFPATGLAVVLATIGPFIYQYLRQQAEEVILKEQKRYQRALRELAKTMTRIRELDKLLRMIVLKVVDTVKVAYAGIYLKNEEYNSYQLKYYYPKLESNPFPEFIPFEHSLINLFNQQRRPLLSEEVSSIDKLSLDAGLFIPCFIEDELLGFMVMGQKPNHQLYTLDDLIVFETLSYSTSLAIENCLFWKEIEDRQRKARLQEMDTYSYSLAHEIDNPIQVIIGQTQLIQRYLLKDLDLNQAKQEELESSFRFILEAAKRISSMVKAIREFGSPTTEEFKPLRINEVIEGFTQLYYPKFKSEGVIFEEKLLEDNLVILGQKPELMQVLVILANNSLYAMRASKEKRITLKIERPNPDFVRIAFSDNGCGIKKELLPIIFSPFTTTKASSEGTGMGLYNAKKIITRHKGKIWAESEGENKGATFYIELPIAKDVSEEKLKEETKAKRLF